MRISTGSVATFFLSALLLAAMTGQGVAEPARPIEVKASYVPLDTAKWERQRVGKLRYRGGLHLTSPEPRFGGLSALMVAPNREDFLALTDRGNRLRGRLAYSENGDLAGVHDVTLEPLRGPDGRALTGDQADAESLSPAPDGGTLVAFERHHRLWIYGDGNGKPKILSPPAGLQNLKFNNGAEAVTLLKDGRLLVVTEDAGADGGFFGWVGGADGWSPVTYAGGEAFKPTGAATLANGDVVVIERRFPLVAARVRLLPADSIQPGAVLQARELARLEGSLTVDNFEGIDVGEGPNGETLIYLVSDDNFHGFQRTLLLMFELVE
jgi:hypothetical protein